MAAEIGAAAADQDGRRCGFNEAAANGRGNRAAGRPDARRAAASMRPRRMAAEIAPGPVRPRPGALLQ